MTGTRLLSGSMAEPGAGVPAQRDVPWSTRSPAGLASVDHLVSQQLSAGRSPGDQGAARPQLASCMAPVTLVNAPSFHPELMLSLPEVVTGSLRSKTGIDCNPTPPRLVPHWRSASAVNKMD